jgi:hypothetical protein
MRQLGLRFTEFCQNSHPIYHKLQNTSFNGLHKMRCNRVDMWQLSVKTTYTLGIINSDGNANMSSSQTSNCHMPQ